MIVVDSSALLAILQGETRAEECRDALAANDPLLIAAPTLAETIIVAAGRELSQGLAKLLDALPLVVLPLTEERALAAAREYVRWGKGFHTAKLNFGDCFAYALTKEQDCALLFVGDDFAKTDVKSAIDRAPPTRR